MANYVDYVRLCYRKSYRIPSNSRSHLLQYFPPLSPPDQSRVFLSTCVGRAYIKLIASLWYDRFLSPWTLRG